MVITELAERLATAFVMEIDQLGLTYEQGVEAAAAVCTEIEFAAEDRGEG